MAAEGMCENFTFGGIIAENNEDFSQGATDLYCDKMLWTTAKSQGLEIIKELYNEEKTSQSFLNSLRKALVETDIRRHKNFVGHMLWHHQHQSTEFFLLDSKPRINSPLQSLLSKPAV